MERKESPKGERAVKFPHETGLILRCAGKAGNPFQTKQGNRPSKKEMATHSSVLAWRIPGTGEPGGLPSMGSHRVGHN